MLCWILHGYFPCSFSSHPRLHPSHQLVGCVVLTYYVQNKCPFKKFKLPECNLVLLTDIWPERKISHRINKVDQDQVKQQQSKRERREDDEDDFERWDFDLAQVTIWQIVPAYKNLFKATEEFIFFMPWSLLVFSKNINCVCFFRPK